ncbi:MAG TPA: hypothetical protein V6C97_27760, partial [Oculatellaceae cyanobacterium]
GPKAHNRDMGKYLHRFFMAIRKAGYKFEYLWTKEFTKKGKLHVHAFITAFVPHGVIKHYWYLATDKTSYIVYIAQAEVRSTAAYMAKYMTKGAFNDEGFRPKERRYGMSKGFREAWPELAHQIKEADAQVYEFFYKPDNTKKTHEAWFVIMSRKTRKARIRAEIEEMYEGPQVKVPASSPRPRRKAKHDKSNIIRGGK